MGHSVVFEFLRSETPVFHMNQRDESPQYSAILHAVRETYNTGNTFTLILWGKNKRRSMMPQIARQKHLPRDRIIVYGMYDLPWTSLGTE